VTTENCDTDEAEGDCRPSNAESVCMGGVGGRLILEWFTFCGVNCEERCSIGEAIFFF
jgi:hypothetical protein